MAIPFIIAGAAIAAAAFGGKKAYDGYQTKSEADDILSTAKDKYDSKKEELDRVNNNTSIHLEKLGALELQIGKDFNKFNTIAQEILKKINKSGNDISITIPRHEINKIENLAISATEYLGTVVGAGASSAAAGFAVYGGVMAFAAASTGTPIAALSGAAAYNATMAAIGGGSLAAGGWGMAGGAMVLGGAVVAPILAIAGWAYANHAEKALDNAQKIRSEVSSAVKKMELAQKHLIKTKEYVVSIYDVLTAQFKIFEPYLLDLIDTDKKMQQNKAMGRANLEGVSENIIKTIENGYKLAAIMTHLITTPLFKPQLNDKQEAVITDGVIQIQTDSNGLQVLNQDALEKQLNIAKNATLS
ncbi:MULTISPECIES: chemotaxis protein [Enterobacterales]|uniref:chemotaxis protein n=1 Tax=Enterobacterales TaxID=91347 RepID=UPI000848115F|nr:MULTISPECIES: chemotaxis protein [Enterobacterales]WOO50201.1 chemotaxis protein [Hafnia alvei]MCT6517652.1 chemotaxis protein [Proteus vulgaris]ODQ06862.1 chemotaxis protein [Shigella sp. FC130]OEI94834.1 chemotaxis protein [Shigella sp. FC1655]WPF04665.1 chemotaxis protein [Proteus vulgaris]